MLNNMSYNGYVFTTTDQISETISMVYKCQPINFQLNNSLKHFPEEYLKSSVMAIAKKKDIEIEWLQDKNHYFLKTSHWPIDKNWFVKQKPATSKNSYTTNEVED